MSSNKKERLSKLQKWIITECFKVTVLLDKTGLEETKGNLCYNQTSKEYYKECKNFVSKNRDRNNGINYHCSKYNRSCDRFKFYRDDILLSYFKLTADNYKYPFSRQQHFKGGPANNKAYVSLGRSINNLYQKGYIWVFWYEGMEIGLTDKGRAKALELLNLDDNVIEEPPPLNEKEQEEKKKEMERELRMITAQLKSH